MTQLDNVREFMEGARQTIGGGLDVPETIALRIKLIDEEYDELLEAINWGERSQIAKELADLLYVVHGTAISFGIPLDDVFGAVHRSNMTKISTHQGSGDVKVSKGPNYVDPIPEIQEILTLGSV